MITGLSKYISTDRDKLKWFTEKQILLTPPEYFNDPWDFRVRFEPYTDAQLESKAQEMQLSVEHHNCPDVERGECVNVKCLWAYGGDAGV